MILVSTRFPEEIPSFRASRRAEVAGMSLGFGAEHRRSTRVWSVPPNIGAVGRRQVFRGLVQTELEEHHIPVKGLLKGAAECYKKIKRALGPRHFDLPSGSFTHSSLLWSFASRCPCVWENFGGGEDQYGTMTCASASGVSRRSSTVITTQKVITKNGEDQKETRR